MIGDYLVIKLLMYFNNQPSIPLKYLVLGCFYTCYYRKRSFLLMHVVYMPFGVSLTHMTWLCTYTPRYCAIIKQFCIHVFRFDNVLCLYAFLCFFDIYMTWLYILIHSVIGLLYCNKFVNYFFNFC